MPYCTQRLCEPQEPRFPALEPPEPETDVNITILPLRMDLSVRVQFVFYIECRSEKKILSKYADT